jgi:HEAT repeat protein
MRIAITAIVGALFFVTASAQAQPSGNSTASMSTTPPNEIGGKTLDEWIRQIDNPDPSVREHAIRCVMLFGPSARRAIPSLVRQVRNDNDYSPLSNAIIILSQLMAVEKDQEYAKMTVNALIQALNHPQAIVRYQAATALGYCGHWARPAVPKLAGMINDRSSWETRRAVCFALGNTARNEQGIPDILALRALIDAIDDPSKEVRAAALQSIINLGPPTGQADISVMKNLLEKRLKADKDNACKIWVRVAIMRVDEKLINDANLSVISKLMKDSDVDVALQAARALYFIGRESKLRMDDLIDALKHSEARMRVQVVETLERIGPAAERAIPALETLQKSDPDEGVRNAAKKAILTIKNVPRVVTPKP